MFKLNDQVRYTARQLSDLSMYETRDRSDEYGIIRIVKEDEYVLDWISSYVNLSTIEGHVHYEEWHNQANLIVVNRVITYNTFDVCDRDNFGFGVP